MRIRVFIAAVVILNLLQLIIYLHKQVGLAAIINKAGDQLKSLQINHEGLNDAFAEVSRRHEVTGNEIEAQYDKMRLLTEDSRKNFIRIKGVKEKSEENLEEKIVELAEFLDVQMTLHDIERANRIGVQRNGARVIVAQISNYKLKQTLIRKASALSGNIEFFIQDDVTNYVMPAGFAGQGSPNNKECGLLKSVEKPILRSKSRIMFGSWLRDPNSSEKTSSSIWVLSHFFENKIVEEYSNLRDLAHKRPRVTYELPYEWAGTGHAIYNGSLFYNKYNSSIMVKFNFNTKSVLVEKTLPDAAFGNTAPYQWSGSTDIDFAIDELGLWVIYATSENALDIVISKLNPDTLEILNTWKTNLRKQWSANAFVACGVLYVLKKYDDRDTYLSYMYDTNTRTYKHINIHFQNKYEWNSMLAYNHRDKMLYAWDRGYLVNYNTSFTAAP